MKVEISDILELPVSKRIQLAQEIWDSIAEVPEAVSLTDSDKREIDRRLEAYYADPQAGSTWQEVKARILRSR